MCGLGLVIVPVGKRMEVYRRVGIVEGVPVKNFVGRECMDIILI